MATTAEIERVEAKIIAQQGAKSCDKYDYLIATGCGVVAGLVDSFLWECLEKASWEAGQMLRWIRR